MSTPKKYTPAITPGLRKLLWIIFILVALLGANSVYLVTVTAMSHWTGDTYENYFYQYMVLGHLALGLLLILPFLVFSLVHMRNTWKRKNRRAVAMGYGVFGASLVLLISGLLLTRAEPVEVRSAAARSIFYWTHVISPLVVVWLYCLHRLAGPPIKWRVGASYVGIVAVACVVLVMMHNSDPRQWNQIGSPEGVKYFEPSFSRTTTGKFIPEQVLANDKYCLECHPDIHAAWAESAHRFSSFNNPVYLVSVRETREFSKQLDGNVRRARWCAGCHDPVPFFSGKFDDPNFDDVADPTARAGITCTACHAITNVNSTRGNADFTIEEPLHYPFTFSENAALKWINRQLIKAKPAFHKKTFLKPLHKTTEFCSTCHKVHLPEELNSYKFLRGQNHYDGFLLSGVSGGGARSFYYPPVADTNCNRCHMPVVASDDFSARRFDPDKPIGVHDHLFPGANTALPYWHGAHEAQETQAAILRDCMRIDIFGVRAGATVDSPLQAPIEATPPALEPGKAYLLEVVLRTLTLGHEFTQGTADSNEVWVELAVKNNGQVLGRSGEINDDGTVDPWSHFVNAFVLDRDGNRINRRNAQDIVVPLYNHQMPPGAGQTVHYLLRVPPGIEGAIEVEARIRYRKFDQELMAIVHDRISDRDPPVNPPSSASAAKGEYRNDLPVVDIATDRVTFPVAADQAVASTESRAMLDVPAWQRWNDYGIGLLLKGTGELKQAAQAFAEVEKLGRYDGPINLGRVYFREGRLDEAVQAAQRAAAHTDPPAPTWTTSWLSGLINREQGHLEQAEHNFRSVLDDVTAEMQQRGFNFSHDYEVINLLGQTLFDQARRLRGPQNEERRIALLREAVAQFQKTLEVDVENVTAHYNLAQLYSQLGDEAASQRHRALHAKYKPDDNARDRAVSLARQKYPAANHAAEAVVIYDLQRDLPAFHEDNAPSHEDPSVEQPSASAVE
ncbi:MAG: hypothetical protein KDA60_02370 [Planctomycetales bacterium]|nr:hypothetical protein [Planctomycetales bacterium]